MNLGIPCTSDLSLPVLHRAKWVVPVSSPVIENGAVITVGRRILEVGRLSSLKHGFAGTVQDHGASIITPSFINAHTHLELSYLKGRLPKNKGFVRWVREIVGLIAERNQTCEKSNLTVENSIKEAISEIHKNKCAAVGDVGNLDIVPDKIRKKQKDELQTLSGIFFKEIICSGQSDFLTDSFISKNIIKHPDSMDITLSAHAPYSVHSDALKTIKKANRLHGLPFTIHVSESFEENMFMESGTGPLCDFLNEKRGEDASLSSPGLSSVKYLHKLGVLDSKTICVHCVHIDKVDMEILSNTGATVCLCPESNRFIGVGKAPVSDFFKSNINVVLGTDSFASNSRLSIFNEMSAVSNLAPDVHPDLILRSATINGALSLGIESDFGTLEAGKSSNFAVHCVDNLKQHEIIEKLVAGFH